MTDHRESARARLSEHLDERGELAPPWEEFPAYEKSTIGWRMGSGEDWLSLWYVFKETLDRSYEARHAYLRRHRPAPESWARAVWHTLYPDEEYPEELSDEQLNALREEGLIGSDVAYETWLLAQHGEWSSYWPWEWSDTPEEAARYWTRELWFFGRRAGEARARQEIPELPAAIPDAWQEFAQVLRAGDFVRESTRDERGLWQLAMMCAVGEVFPPWSMEGCAPEPFDDSYELDMGHASAYRLWYSSAFDDVPHAHRVRGEVPAAWEAWVEEQLDWMYE